MVWRVLLYMCETGDVVRSEYRADVLAAMLRWRNFIDGSAPNPGPNELHLWPIVVDPSNGFAVEYRDCLVEFAPMVHPDTGELYVLE